MSTLAIKGGTKAVDTPFPAWPVHDAEDERNLLEVLHSGKWWYYAYGGGPNAGSPDGGWISHTEQFERDFARAHFVKHCYGVSTGTCALELSLKACGVGPGDEVITTPYTFIATSSAIMSLCALPVYVDIDPETYNLDARQIAQAITPKTRAIVVVHFGGEIADMDAILAITRRCGLAVIEDAAQATGSILTGDRAAGGMGDAGIFSFQASKVMTAGEGGACTTQDDAIAERLWSLRNCGRIKTGLWYEHHRMGHNNRMTEFQGVLLRGQLRRLAGQCERRLRNYHVFLQAIEGLPGVRPRHFRADCVQRSMAVVVMRFTAQGWDGVTKPQLLKALQAEGVPISGGYGWANYSNPAMTHLQEHMGDKAFAFGVERFPDYAACAERCPVAERACSREALFLLHDVFLGDETQTRKLADAFLKVYAHRADCHTL